MSLWLAKTVSGGAPRRHGGDARHPDRLPVPHRFAAVGLTAILAASATAFTAIKVVGALYLAWLALDAIRSGSALNVRALSARGDALLADLSCRASAINLTNPKVVLFFLTFLPQFVGAHDPHAAGKLLFLGLFFIGVNIPLSFVLILGAESVIGWLKARPGILRAIDYTFAGVFGFFAFKILTTQGR